MLACTLQHELVCTNYRCMIRIAFSLRSLSAMLSVIMDALDRHLAPMDPVRSGDLPSSDGFVYDSSLLAQIIQTYLQKFPLTEVRALCEWLRVSNVSMATGCSGMVLSLLALHVQSYFSFSMMFSCLLIAPTYLGTLGPPGRILRVTRCDIRPC